MSDAESIEFDTQISHLDDGVVVFVIGELDLSNSERLSEALVTAAKSSSNVIVDLSDTTFVDSSGLSALVRAQQHLDASRGSLQLRAPRKQALMAVQAAGLEHVLSIKE